MDSEQIGPFAVPAMSGAVTSLLVIVLLALIVAPLASCQPERQGRFETPQQAAEAAVRAIVEADEDLATEAFGYSIPAARLSEHRQVLSDAREPQSVESVQLDVAEADGGSGQAAFLLAGFTETNGTVVSLRRGEDFLITVAQGQGGWFVTSLFSPDGRTLEPQ